MSSNIITVSDPWISFTQLLAQGSATGLPSGSARQSTVVDNTLLQRPAANVAYLIESGAGAPTAGGIYEIFLFRREDTTTAAGTSCVADDAAGTADAAITILNSQLIGTLVVTASATTNFFGVFTTANLGVIGPAWGTSVRNSSGGGLNNTEGNHRKRYATYYNRAL
jgi:hypothetical protein